MNVIIKRGSFGYQLDEQNVPMVYSVFNTDVEAQAFGSTFAGGMVLRAVQPKGGVACFVRPKDFSEKT